MSSSTATVDKNFAVEPFAKEPAMFEVGEELDRLPSIKILPKKEVDTSEVPSYFARWFEMVPPNKDIQESEYFWHTGTELAPDHWTSDEKLDEYLGLNSPSSTSAWGQEESSDEETAMFPPVLSLDLSDDEESVTSEEDVEILWDDMESVSSVDSWSLSTISVDENSLALPSFSKAMSDWNEMPALFPKLNENEVSPEEMLRQQSDWTQMPEKLPPLHEAANLKAPALEHQKSDWTKMPTILPPLMQHYASEPSEWVAMPENVVPRNVPQASWDSGFDQSEYSSPMWLKNADGSSFPYDSTEETLMTQQQGMVQRQEMEFLSSDENTVSQTYAPAVYQHNYPTMGMMAPNPAALYPQTALVQYQPTLTNATFNANSNNMVVARQPNALPQQYSFVCTGGEYNMIFCHVPCGTYVTPSKIATEVWIHLVFPVLYVHSITGRVISGYAYSSSTINTSFAQSYFYPTMQTSVGRKARDVVQVN